LAITLRKKEKKKKNIIRKAQLEREGSGEDDSLLVNRVMGKKGEIEVKRKGIPRTRRLQKRDRTAKRR